MTTSTIKLNEHGHRIGESHPRSKLLDREIDQVHALRAEKLTLEAIALKFDVSKSCIAHIVSGRRRGQAIAKVVRA